MTVHRFPKKLSLGRVPAWIDGSVPIVKLAHALATEGLTLSNLPSGGLLIHELPAYLRKETTMNDEAEQYDEDALQAAEHQHEQELLQQDPDFQKWLDELNKERP